MGTNVNTPFFQVPTPELSVPEYPGTELGTDISGTQCLNTAPFCARARVLLLWHQMWTQPYLTFLISISSCSVSLLLLSVSLLLFEFMERKYSKIWEKVLQNTIFFSLNITFKVDRFITVRWYDLDTRHARFWDADSNRKRTFGVPGPYCLPDFYYYSSLMEKRYLAIWKWLCEGKLKVKIVHFRLPSASQKRACSSSLLYSQSTFR